MRVTKEFGHGRAATHIFPRGTTPEVIDAYGAAVTTQLEEERESALDKIFQKPVTHLTPAEQKNFMP